MSNPLIGLLAKQANSSMPGPMQMISQFSQFRQNWTPQAAQAKINEMIQSGQINTNAHNIVSKLVSDYKSSEEYREHPEYADGMMAVWNATHANLVKRSAEITAMITAFK